jgi:hypothetical protein
MTDRPLPVLLAFVAALSAGAAFAQGPETVDPAYTNLSNYLVNQNRLATEAIQVDPQYLAGPSGGNVSSVTQNGSSNSATVDIQGGYNLTTQTQNGAGDVSTLVIVGSSNTVSSTQVGSGDSYSLTLNGNANSVTQTQVGSNLTYSLTVAGDAKTISVTQIGRGH